MKILISGIGIAGPCLAYWLLKKGNGRHEIVMIERSPELRTGGYLIDFWGIGYEIARRMGLESRIHEIGYKASDTIFVNEQNESEGGFKMEILDEILDRKFATVLRSDLAKLIYEELPLDSSKNYPAFSEEDKTKIQTRFGTEITNISTEQSGDSAISTVTFNDGSVEQFDLVVGADGLHSKVRELAFKDVIPPEGPLKDLGMTVAATAVTGNFVEKGFYLACSIPGRTVIAYKMNGDQCMVLFIASESAKLDNLATPADRKNWVLNMFKDHKWKAPDLLKAVEGVPDLYVDTVSQTRLDTWKKLGVVLVGDAAGAPSLLAGEGTGLGVTGAYCLAHALNTSQNPESALDEYEALFKPFVTKKQNQAGDLLYIFGPKSWFQIWIRNTLSRLFMIKPVARWIFGSFLRDDIELPAYEIN